MDPALFEGLFAEILAPLINGTLSKLSEGAKAQWKKVGDKKAAEAYKAKLTKRYGTIQILGQPRPQKLGKVYTDVYLHEKPTSTYAEEKENLEEQFRVRGKRFGRSERTDGLAFAKEHERLFILGKPGSGKTTFLKYLTMQAAEGDIPLIPIFVSLNDFQHQNVALLDYLAEQFDVCDFPEAESFIEQLLRKEKGLVLFDGLDEVSKEDSQRSTITRQLKQFMLKYDANRFAITCRIAASDYQFQNFDYVEMADFTYKQVEAFVRKWFAESKPKIDGFFKELWGSGSKGIKEMTTSPLLLTLLCIQYDGSMALLPSRSEVYEEALEILLKTWDGHRDINRGDLIVEDEDRYKALTFKRKMQLMSRLAYGTFKDSKLFIEQKLLEDKIVDYIGKIPKGPDPELVDGGVVLKTMESQHGLLVERATRIYSFSHLTLQEYFTAKYIVDYAKSGAALSSLIGAEKIADPRWREVFLFVAELLPSGDEFVIWMAETLQEMANIGELKKIIYFAEILNRERSLNILCKNDMASRATYVYYIFNYAMDYSDASTNKLRQKTLSNPISQALKDVDVAIENARYKLDQGVSFIEGEVVQNLKNAFSKLNDESNNLGWIEFSVALTRFPQIRSEINHKLFSRLKQALYYHENAFLVNNWRNKWTREVHTRSFVETIKLWMFAHELMFDCLDRVVLKDLDRAEFEDEYLYRLPRHARPQLSDES